MKLELIHNRKNSITKMDMDSEKEHENNESFVDKVEAGAKAVGNKINNPGTDLNLEYEKEKAKDDLDEKDDTEYISSEQSYSSENYSISESNIPSFRKILATYDGKEESNKAINYSIYLSNLSGAEVIILQIIDNIEKLEDTSINISNEHEQSSSSLSDKHAYLKKIEGQLASSMDEKIKKIEQAGCKNKVSYIFKAGNAIDEIVNEIKESDFDLVVMTSSHMDSWLKSLFSDTRKIISKINIPVLIAQ